MSEELIAAIHNIHAEISEAVGFETETHQPRQIADLRDLPPTPVNAAILRAGYRARLSVPLMRSGDVVGALVVRRKEPGESRRPVVSLMQTFAEQSAIALENARLFNEIAQKSRELEIASHHNVAVRRGAYVGGARPGPTPRRWDSGHRAGDRPLRARVITHHFGRPRM